jgi:hypothetical protein
MLQPLPVRDRRLLIVSNVLMIVTLVVHDLDHVRQAANWNYDIPTYLWALVLLTYMPSGMSLLLALGLRLCGVHHGGREHADRLRNRQIAFVGAYAGNLGDLESVVLRFSRRCGKLGSARRHRIFFGLRVNDRRIRPSPNVALTGWLTCGRRAAPKRQSPWTLRTGRPSPSLKSSPLLRLFALTRRGVRGRPGASRLRADLAACPQEVDGMN